jgi:hypothetical protein
MTTPLPSTDDDWLEQALRAQAREHRDAYLDDAGFTARVIDALPPAVEPVPTWRRPVVATLWAAAAAAGALALPGVALDVGREAFRLLAAQPVSLPQIATALVAVGAVTWTAAAWALRSD